MASIKRRKVNPKQQQLSTGRLTSCINTTSVGELSNDDENCSDNKRRNHVIEDDCSSDGSSNDGSSSDDGRINNNVINSVNTEGSDSSDDSSDDAHSEESDDSDGVVSGDKLRLRAAKDLIQNLKGVKGQQSNGIIEELQHETDMSLNRVHRLIADDLTIGPVTFYRGHKLTATCVTAAADNEDIVFTGGKDCAIIKWDIETGQKIVFAGGRKSFNCGGHFEQVLGICVNHSGNLICSGGEDRVVRLWDTRASNTKSIISMRGHMNRITSICCDPEDTDLHELYTTSDDKTVKTWSLNSQRNVDSFYGHTRAATCSNIAAKQRPVTGGEDGTIRMWKLDKGTHLIFDKMSLTPVDSCAAITATNCVAGDQSGSINMWSTSHRKPLCVKQLAHGDGFGITALAAVPHSDLIISGSHDGKMRFWKSVGVHSTNESMKFTKKTSGKIPKVKIDEIAAVDVNGFINGVTLSKSKRHLFGVVGREHRLGRWLSKKSCPSGLIVIPLAHSAIEEM